MGKNHILPDHCGGLTPPRPAFQDEQFRIAFAGKPVTGDKPNPGSPNDRDPRYAERLIEMFGPDRRILYVIGDHSGQIGFYDGGLLAIVKHHSNDHQVVTLVGDACIVDYRRLTKPCTTVLRTWDCGNIAIVNVKQKRVAVVHCSITTEGGYKAKDFLGPISKRVMRKMGNPSDCYVAFGPSIAGIADDRGCRCYEFGLPDSEVLFSNLHRLHPGIELNDLRLDHLDPEKTYIRFGELLTRIFESYGFKRHRQIDLTANRCPCCEHDLFYSNRYTRQQLTNDCPEADRLPHVRQMEAGYGNVTAVHFS